MVGREIIQLLEKVVLFGASGKHKVADFALNSHQKWCQIIVELEREREREGGGEEGGEGGDNIETEPLTHSLPLTFIPSVILLWSC